MVIYLVVFDATCYNCCDQLACFPLPVHTNDLQQQTLMLLIIFKALEVQ
jgi:hypothetical protein